MMQHIYHKAADLAERGERICLATVLTTKGSTPQVPGSSAVFSEKGLLEGTLGGGVMEGDAQRKAIEAIRNGQFLLYDFLLNAGIDDREGALCGGNALILLDPEPGQHLECFREMTKSLSRGDPGLLITMVNPGDDKPIARYWYQHTQPKPKQLIAKWPDIEKSFTDCLQKGKCSCQENESGEKLFIEPLFPVPKLVIAGAGHIGRALAHMGSLLDFEVTVIDDRPEFANPENIPDAKHIIVKPIGDAMSEVSKTDNTYIVIVTRGHNDDSAALKACIHHDLPYIGMIGSKNKVRQVKEKFIAEGWCSPEEFERVHAPIGIDIGSVSVQEIALSIAAQLVQVRTANRKEMKKEYIVSVILAAGESRRMGEPKMLLPYGDSTILKTVICNTEKSGSNHVRVVLGADAEAIGESIAGMNAELVHNALFRNGMLSSVQEGLKCLPIPTTAVMILLGDQPMISAETMDRVIARYRQSEKGILIASANGKRGHPMIFNTKYVPEILSYGKDNSLRDLAQNHPGDVEEIETGQPAILRDIDTPQDYENEFKT